MNTCADCGELIFDPRTKRCRNCNRAVLAANRIGPANPNWKGIHITAQSGRDRAHRRFPDLLNQPCKDCTKHPAHDLHHVDHNPLNNAAENVIPLCRRCHMTRDGRLSALKTANKRGLWGRRGGLAWGKKRRSLAPKCAICGAKNKALALCAEHYRQFRYYRAKHHGTLSGYLQMHT